MKHSSPLWLAILLSSCAGAADAQAPLAGPEAARRTRPNVLLVMTDDQGYGDLACLGNPILETPHLDQLHGEAVRLTDYHVSPTCSPTRGALMSGRNTHHAGVWHTIMGRSMMRTEEVTLAETFRANGYATGHFGKWHLGDNYPLRPQDQGFEVALMHGGGGVVQGPDTFGNDYFDDTYLRNGVPETFTGFCTDVWFDEAMRFITESQDAERPFFCYVPTNAAHGPFWAPEEYEQKYRDDARVPNAGFYGMIENIDANMGRMLAFLEERGLADDTIVIFTTDNGSTFGLRKGKGFNAGMRGSKGSFHEGGHRVPCFIRWSSGGLAGGRDVDTLAAHFDLYPTLMELCGLERPGGPELHGRSLVPRLQGTDEAWPERVIVVDSQRRELMQKHKSFAEMTERWRLCTGDELFDIVADPGQTTDVSAEHPDVVARLQAEYEQYWQGIAPLNETYVRIVLGHPAENPTRLMSHDLHTDDKGVPWHQRHVRRAYVASGFWAVEVHEAGTYRIELRRWPQEVGLPIDAPLPEDPWVTDNRLQEPGVAIHPVEARLSLGGIERTVPIAPGDLGATFDVELKAGPDEMYAWFRDEDGTLRSAYYVYVERR